MGGAGGGAPACNDMTQNGDETDVDCGGGTCPQCDDGKTCIVDTDCVSDICDSGVCLLAVNGCDPATAVTMPTTVTFPNANTTYDPKCLKVSLNASVTFMGGDFSMHPLQGGVVAGNVTTPALSGPFVPVTSSGTQKAFTMDTLGSYPYYCVPHGTLGMNGVVYVVP
jgi:plastocyanin